MNAPLSPAQVKQVMAEVVSGLIEQHKEDFDLVTQYQAAGLLNMDFRALKDLKLRPIHLAERNGVRYSIADIKAYLRDNQQGGAR